MKYKPTILVIVGITGDLSRRKLLPAINHLGQAGEVPEQLQILGVSRSPDIEVKHLITHIEDPSYLLSHTEMFQMDLTQHAEYARLAKYIEEIEERFGAPAQRLFYLSVPPQVSRPIIDLLGASGLAAGDAKLLLEKPFGTDLASATELINHINNHFRPEQVYRIDHFLAKEMAQNLLVVREENILFKRAWNKDFIERIDIVASEQLDIEGRAAFYEQTGALRDFIQNHLLQLAALTLMDAPDPDELQMVPERRLAALKQLRLASVDDPLRAARRGQYEGYREQVGNPASAVETFAAVTLESDDPRWQGVPITLATGKALKEKRSEIRITYRPEGDKGSNELVLRIDPGEGMELHLWAKRPGYDPRIEQRTLRMEYGQNDHLPPAYERVILDAIRSDRSLFVANDEILETWRILDPLQRAWSMPGDDLFFYKPGSDMNELLKDFTAALAG